MSARRAPALALALGLALPALAEAPATSPRPVPRPISASASSAAVPLPAAGAWAPLVSLRPLARPGAPPLAQATIAAAVAEAASPVPEPAAVTAPRDPVLAFLASLAHPGAAQAAPAPPGATALAVARSPAPPPRPDAPPVTRIALPRATARGSVCGVNDIKGVEVGVVSGPGRCGIGDAVLVRAVSGVTVAEQPEIDCTTAKALNTWLRTGIIPAVGRRGGGVARIDVIGSYSCRTRNSVPGAKLSEHALGHAIDVAGITLKDGTVITVAKDWSKSRYSKIIRAIHDSACGPFGTVLGPKADRYHWNHIHVDTARYRGGAYCR